MSGFLPRPQQPFLDRNGLVDPIWRDYLRSLTPDAASAELQQQVNALGLRVGALEAADEAGIGNVVGRDSLTQYGTLAQGSVQIALIGDEANPDAPRYYGTDESGERGYHELPTNQLFQRMDTAGDFRITADGHLRVTN